LKVLTANFTVDSRKDTISIVPIGDVHIGAAACDEQRLKSVVDRVLNDDNCYWTGMGDYCDFINVSDPRFNISTLAPWIGMKQMSDLARSQRDYFLDMIKPIASKCIGLVQGNHEASIHHFYERDIYGEIVTEVKALGGMPAEKQLALDYYGWILLKFNMFVDSVKPNVSTIKTNWHHGYVGGKLAGGKALEMQRWLWSHDADIVCFGHSHNTSVQVETIESINTAGKLLARRKYGVFSGSFLRSNVENVSTYSERKGYLPMPTSGVEIVIRPGAMNRPELQNAQPIRIITSEY